jgi:hypothetical protein
MVETPFCQKVKEEANQTLFKDRIEGFDDNYYYLCVQQ